MKKTIVALGLVLVMLLGVTYVYAQGPGFGPGFGPGHRGTPFQESWCQGRWSSLTPEQQTKFQELRRKFREENAKLIGAMVTKRLELQSLWTDPKADPKAILDKERELRDLQNQMRDKAVQMRLEARKFLTPEQIASFGPGCGIGPGFGRGHRMGYGPGAGRGYGMIE
jgi:Spy/CpxP family protein refolding chaperone